MARYSGMLALSAAFWPMWHVTYNCVHQGNKVHKTTAPESAHSYGRDFNCLVSLVPRPPRSKLGSPQGFVLRGLGFCMFT
ncbi:hypothetical protein J6590_089838 [Homalodisca vitripennis]|nr:hypothetical protein J6590_089838 [Homalodisca vitripennis]